MATYGNRGMISTTTHGCAGAVFVGTMTMSRTKQVIVMRTDLNMRKGKMIAQGAHASMKVLLDHGYGRGGCMWWEELYDWLDNSFAKVCLQVDSEEKLLELKKKAEGLGIPTALVTDSGRTEFHGVPTNTCIAIGPAENKVIDSVTGSLKLL